MRLGRRSLLIGGGAAATTVLAGRPAQAADSPHALRAVAAYDATQAYFHDPARGRRRGTGS